MMLCAVIGIVPPPEKDQWEAISRAVTENVGADEGSATSTLCVSWRGGGYTVLDDGVETMLVNAVSETNFSMDDLMASIESSFRDAGTNVVCELWASAPAPLPLRPWDGYTNHLCFDEPSQQRRYNNTEETDDGTNSINNEPNNNNLIHQRVETLQCWGVSVQRSLLKEGQVKELRGLVDTAITKVEESLQRYRPDICVGQDTFHFREISSRSTQRFDLRMQDDKTHAFVHRHLLETNPTAAAVLEQVLDCTATEMDFDVSVVYSKPGAGYQGWHADGDHHKGAKDAGLAEDGWRTELASPYAVCLFIPLIDLDEQVGYTQFWPASHRNRDLVGFGKVAELAEATFDGVCSVGDAVWYDYRLFHRGMPNTSTDTLRPVVQIIFKRAWYVERANYGTEGIADL